MTRVGITCLAFAVVASAALTATPTAFAQVNLPKILAWDQSLRGAEEQRLRWPVAVAAGSTDEIAVADAFDPKVLLFRKIGISWELDRTALLPAVPVALTHDGRRYIAALREGHRLIALEGPQLMQRRITVPQGVVPGPIAARTDGSLLLYDAAAGRVLELASGGEVAGEVKIDGHVTALAAAPDGGFYVAIGDGAGIQRHHADGELVARWKLPQDGPVPAWPAAIAVVPGEGVAVVDRHGARVLLIDNDGRALGSGSRRGWEPGLLLFPSAIARLPDGSFVVADQGNGRAQIFRRTD
jgi:hypothetical protein